MSENKPSIIVRVQDSTEKEAVVGATVKLFAFTAAPKVGAPVEPLQVQETDSHGRVRFDVPTGKYTVATTAFGLDADPKHPVVRDDQSTEIVLEIPVGLKLEVTTLGDNKEIPCPDL